MQIRKWLQRLLSPSSDFSVGPDSHKPAAMSVDADGDPYPEMPNQTVQVEITDILDLHMFSPRDAAEVVRTYLDEARARGLSTVRIIHGKGIGAQRAMVHSILGKTVFVASFQDAPAEAGGWGATVVWFTDSI